MKSTVKPQIKKPRVKVSATVRMLLIYFTICISAYAALSFFSGMVASGSWLYFLLVLGMLLLGGVHLWSMSQYFEWDRPILQKSLFTIALTFVAFNVFYLLLSNSQNTFNIQFAFASLAFCLPCFYKLAIEKVVEVPDKIYKSYRILNFDDIDRGEITFEENERGLIWEFKKEEMTADLSLPTDSVRMFAPAQVFRMPFKKLFKASVLFYNVRLNPEKPIQVFETLSDGEQIYYEWYFMHRPISFLPPKYIDPDKTVAENGLKFSKRKTNYGKEILAPEIFVIRKQHVKRLEPNEIEVEEEADNIADGDPNVTGATGTRLEF